MHRVDLTAPEFKRNPFAFYARLREIEPVCKVDTPYLGKLWLVTRYEDVAACLKDAHAFVKDPRNAGLNNRKAMPWWLPRSIRALEQNMIDTDDPDHRRLRALVSKAFTRCRIDALRDRVDQMASRLIDQLPASGTVDLVASYAVPLPLTVICELLGVPVADQAKVHRWSASILATTSQLKTLRSVPHIFAFISYLKRLFAARRAEPKADLITELVQVEDQGERLSEQELIAMVIVLIIAGHETTTNLIGSGVLALLEAPEQRQRLMQQPALMPSAVEELLRFTAPVETATERYASRTLELCGAPIERGDLVLAAIASANRDPAQFADPDRLDLVRSPNPHVGFGDGPHFCLGYQLARMEAGVAFARLFERYPQMQLAVPRESLRWRRAPVVRGLAALPVTLVPA